MSSKLGSLKSRVLVAVVGIPLLLWVLLWASKTVMMVVFMALAGIGAAELQMCVSGGKKSELTGLSAIAAISTVEWYVSRPEHVAIFFVFLAVAVFSTGLYLLTINLTPFSRLLTRIPFR